MRNAIASLLVITLSVCLLGIIGNLTGCAVDSSSSDPNSDPNDDLFLYHSGTLSGIYYFSDGGYERYHETQFNFDDGEVIRINRLESKNRPKIGDYGALFIDREYKDYSPDRCQNANFKWVRMKAASNSKTKLIPVSTEKVRSVTVVPFTMKQREITTDGRWKYPAVDMPFYGQPVLAKLKNGSFAIIYVNKKEEWKLDSNKNKISGGLSVDNVEKWKEVDLN